MDLLTSTQTIITKWIVVSIHFNPNLKLSYTEIFFIRLRVVKFKAKQREPLLCHSV